MKATLIDCILEEWNNGDSIEEIAKNHNKTKDYIQKSLVNKGIITGHIPVCEKYVNAFDRAWCDMQKLYCNIKNLDNIKIVVSRNTDDLY